MYKLLILAYLITQDPIATQQTFQMQQTYNTMEDCKRLINAIPEITK